MGDDKPRNIGRRTFLWSLSGLAASTVLYMRYVEPEWLEVKRQRINIGLGDSRALRVLHLSDLHVSGRISTDYICDAIQRGLQLNPDLVLITGDFYTSGDEAPLELERRVLPLFDGSVPVYAVFGNHDGGGWAAQRGGYSDTRALESLLKGSVIQVLHNTAVNIRPLNKAISLVGIGDLWGREFNPQIAFAATENVKRVPRIVLAHNPDSKQRLLAYDWDLMLSGHTHGGQLSLPIFGEPFVPVKDKRFIAGLYKWESRQLHISKGIGNMRGLRLGARPDICLLELV